MLKCVNICAPALRAGLLAGVIIPVAAARADNCVTEPNQAAAPGSHWVYHLDHATNRKCWYLMESGGRTPVAPPAEQPPAPEPGPPAFSLFSWWTAGSSTPAPPPASALPDPRGGAESKSRALRQMDAQAFPQTSGMPKPHRPAVVRATTAHDAPLTEQERDALFQEFLRWKDGQKPQ